MDIDESAIPVPDPAPADFPRLHDIGYFKKRLKAAFQRVASIRPYRMESLGQVNGEDIILISPEELQEGKANILTAGGFHGEEPAGPWGIVEYLETATREQLESVNHSFLPLVNPTGFAVANRFNAYGENPNRGFIVVPPEIEKDISGNNRFLSKEGDILTTHLTRLLHLAQDGFVTQHEDWRMEDAYIFINERQEMPSPFALSLRNVLSRHFNLAADDDKTKDGIWHNDLDGSFESVLYFYGVPCIATTETPGQQPARRRIDCNREIAGAFAGFMAKKGPAAI